MLQTGSYSEHTHIPVDVFHNIFWMIKHQGKEEEFLAENMSDKIDVLYRAWKADILCDLVDEGLIDQNGEEFSYLLNEELFDLLNSMCPDYCYFGAHIGNGSDFGVWVDMESVENAIQDKEIKCFDGYQGEDFKDPYIYVNDHGNMSYIVDGKEVWAVV